MITLLDAAAERNEWDRKDQIADFKKYTEQKRIESVLAANQHIGVLNGGKFYSYKTGQYIESSRIEDLL
jgi:hypothetical protein